MKRYRLVWCVIGLLFLVTFGDILSRELTVKAAHDFTQARVIAHRGYGNPENSLKAYQSAYDAGFKYVETDVRFTKDNVPVCIHDTGVDRLSNGTGLVDELSLSELQTLDFNGESILTFQDFIAFCVSHDLSPYVDIKNYSLYSQEQIAGLVEMVRQAGWLDRTTWISNEIHYLTYVKNSDDSARIGLLASCVNADLISAVRFLTTGKNEVFLDVNHVTDESVEACKAAQIPLEVWTLERVPQQGQHIDDYISGFTTDVLLN